MPARQEPWSRGLAHPEQREECLPRACAHGTDARPTEMKGVFPILRGETARAHGLCASGKLAQEEMRDACSPPRSPHGDQVFSQFPINL